MAYKSDLVRLVKRKESIRRASKKYYRKMKDNPNFKRAMRLRRQSWRDKNPEKIVAYSQKYYLGNKLSILEKNIRWARGNPTAIKKHRIKHRTGLPIEISTIQSVYESNIKKHGTLTCYLCLKPIEFKKDCLEHRIPANRGGDNSIQNLGVAHISCNSKKNHLTEKEYREKFSKTLV